MSKATVIHLEAAVERKPLLHRMNELFSVEVYTAKDGSKWLVDPRIAKAHPLTKEPVSQGNLGCTHSHIDLIYHALNKESLVLLEDDCEFRDGVDKKDIAQFVHFANTLQPWDILLLGATEYVESEPTASPDYKRIQRFWGTHALILRERGMRAVLKAFHAAQLKGEFLPADWLYSNAIREGLICLGPADPFRFCRQKEGLQSYLTGKVRTYH